MQVTTSAKAKATRTLRWTPNADDVSVTAGALTIKIGDKAETYIVTEFPTGLTGRGFQLTAVVGGQGYACISSHRGARYDTCECPGFLYRSKCKHASAVRKLMDLGKL